MASGWELGMGMGMGMGYGMGIGASVSNSLQVASAHAPNYQPAMNSSAYLYGLPSTDTLRIDDLLDFSNHDVANTDGLIIPKQEIISSVTTGSRPLAGESGSSHSHVSSFADDIYIPTEEAAELEWLSKFVEDSFSDVPYPPNYLPAAAQIRVDPTASAAALGRGARSKRSRAASTSLASPILVAPNQSSSSSSTSSSSSSDFPTPAHISTGGVSSSSSSRKKVVSAASEASAGVEGGVRRCTHCASEKTPQWRTGPRGPKTLCNACGVRYKSGRLVPEYRPAASPTFVLTQHSNSHRKVMELRRQKEQLHSYHQNPNPANFSAAAAAGNATIYH